MSRCLFVPGLVLGLAASWLPRGAKSTDCPRAVNTLDCPTTVVYARLADCTAYLGTLLACNGAWEKGRRVPGIPPWQLEVVPLPNLRYLNPQSSSKWYARPWHQQDDAPLLFYFKLCIQPHQTGPARQSCHFPMRLDCLAYLPHLSLLCRAHASNNPKLQKASAARPSPPQSFVLGRVSPFTHLLHPPHGDAISSNCHSVRYQCSHAYLYLSMDLYLGTVPHTHTLVHGTYSNRIKNNDPTCPDPPRAASSTREYCRHPDTWSNNKMRRPYSNGRLQRRLRMTCRTS